VARINGAFIDHEFGHRPADQADCPGRSWHPSHVASCFSHAPPQYAGRG
jgi:hypothetical protein